MKTIKPESYTKARNLICNYTDQKNYLIHFRRLKFYVRRGMIVDKTHEKISFKQSKWLEKYTSFNIRKRNKTKNEFRKDFYNIFNNAFYGKAMKTYEIL